MGEAVGVNTAPQRDQLMLSLGRILTNNPDFLADFYEVFLDSSPEIAEYFRNTDLDKQKQALSNGLSMIIMFDNEDPIAIDVLSHIRKTHARGAMNIRPELYKFWEDSLMKVIKANDNRYGAELEKEWRRIIHQAVDFISSGYNIY
jgi:hemoglobin-like flavoprotein